MERFLLGVRSVNFGTIMDIISKVLKEMRYTYEAGAGC